MLPALGVAAWALVAALLHGFPGAARAAPDALVLTELAPGVYAHQGQIADFGADNLGDIANFGFVIGARCVAVIDTGSTLRIGQALLAAVRQRTELPVCYVINTHMHLDHVFGNAAFEAPGTTFVAAANLPEALGARAEGYLRTLNDSIGDAAAGTRAVYPTLLVEDQMRLDLGGRNLLLRSWPTAHTNNDLTVFDEASSTLWLGDLLFEGFLPIVDGSILGWLKVMDTLATLPARRVVAGHGALELAWPAALETQRAYLTGVTASVRSALKRGLTLRQVIDADDGSTLSGWALAARFHSRNLSAAYTELEWE